MKFAILLTALASPTLGSLFEHQTDLATQIKNLTRAPDSHGWIQLSSTGHNVQSVDATGNVLDEIPLTPEQEAELRSSFAVKVEQVQTGNSSARSAVRHRGLEKKAPGCADWASICDESADCYQYNCDDCFRIYPRVGVCYSYS